MKAYKTVLISAVIYSVIIGLIYVALSVLAILARNCTIAMDSSPFIYMMFLMFFRNDECKVGINWSNLNLVSDVNAVLPPESDAVHRTAIFAFVYLGLYAALIFTALYSTCGINNSCLGRKSFPMFFAPWIVVCCAIIVMDVLTTVYYVIDMINVTSIDGLIDLLEVVNAEPVAGVFEELSAVNRFLPPLVMFLVTSKCFVFLIMDIVIITLIIKAGWSASTYHKYVEDTVRHYSSNMSRANPAFEDPVTDQVAQKQHDKQIEYMSEQVARTASTREGSAPPETPDRYNDTSVQAFVYPNRINSRNENRQEEEKQNTIPRPNTLALSSKLNDRPTTQHQNNQQNHDREIENRLSHYTASNGTVIRSTEPLKDDSASEKQSQHIRIKVLPTVAELNRQHELNRASSEVKQRPKVPPKPQNPNRASMQPWVEERKHERPESQNSGAKVERNSSSVHAPEELRGQLPWSYFKARDDVPKKAFTELEEDEDLPRVPVPDYTLHFPKAKRANVNDSDGDGSWGRYDQRY